MLEQLGELDNARLVERGLLAGGVITSVLAQVSLLTGGLDARRDLLAVVLLTAAQLLGEAVESILREPGALLLGGLLGHGSS